MRFCVCLTSILYPIYSLYRDIFPLPPCYCIIAQFNVRLLDKKKKRKKYKKRKRKGKRDKSKKNIKRTRHNRNRMHRIRNARKYGEVNRGGEGSTAINRGRSTSDFKDSSWCVRTHRGFRLPLFMLLDPRSSGGPGMSTVLPKCDSTVTINYFWPAHA